MKKLILFFLFFVIGIVNAQSTKSAIKTIDKALKKIDGVELKEYSRFGINDVSKILKSGSYEKEILQYSYDIPKKQYVSLGSTEKVVFRNILWDKVKRMYSDPDIAKGIVKMTIIFPSDLIEGAESSNPYLSEDEIVFYILKEDERDVKDAIEILKNQK